MNEELNIEVTFSDEQAVILEDLMSRHDLDTYELAVCMAVGEDGPPTLLIGHGHVQSVEEAVRAAVDSVLGEVRGEIAALPNRVGWIDRDSTLAIVDRASAA